MSVCNILGTNIEVTNMKKIVQEIKENLKMVSGRYICVANVHTTVMAYEDSSYKNIQNSAWKVLPDGKPLSVVSRIRGYIGAERVTGPDLMDEIFKISVKNGYRHYFYGSTKDTLQCLKTSLESKYPGLAIAGMYSPPFGRQSDSVEKNILKDINREQVQFIWVGLGAPKQEKWMYEHRNKVVGLMIGVGAGFDYHAGNLQRAPKWMQGLSLEWLYRLWQEPERLFMRYLETNSKFIFYLICEKRKGRGVK